MLERKRLVQRHVAGARNRAHATNQRSVLVWFRIDTRGHIEGGFLIASVDCRCASSVAESFFYGSAVHV